MRSRRRAVADGTTIHYRVGGAGDPPLVLVHGWCSAARHWDALVARVEPSHRVLSIDRRGHGRSDVPRRGYTAARHAADLAEILGREALTDGVVVAHAGGAPTALTLAVRRPDLARALVLIDSRIGPGGRLGRPHSAGRSPLGRLIDSLSGPDADRAFEMTYRSFVSEHAGDAGARLVADAQRVPLPVARAELASLAVDTERLARAVSQPVLWLTAGPADDAPLACFRSVEVGRVVGSGHFPHVEVADQVAPMIERFCSMVAGQNGSDDPGDG